MKIIQAMKTIKSLEEKRKDLLKLIQKNCVSFDSDTTPYADQKSKITAWLQSHSDTVKEMERLKHAINKTNVLTDVTIEIGGKQVTKTIDQWISRRRTYADAQGDAWRVLTDQGYPETQRYRVDHTGNEKVFKRILHFDPSLRDQMVELYRSEPSIIDGHLEVVNAITDILE
jgi:hypothetical protein